MASLLPSLSSDDDDEAVKVRIKEKDDSDDDDDDDNQSVLEMDQGFEFGGILGEDGGASSWMARAPSSSSAGWSYQTALDQLERYQQDKDNNNSNNATAVPRLEVEALIQAKRRALLEEEKKTRQLGVGPTKITDADEEEHEDSSQNSSKSGSDSSSASSSDNDEEEDYEEPAKDDSHKDLQEDVLKTRAGTVDPTRKKQTSPQQNDDDDNNNGNESGDDEDDDDDGDEDDKEEAAKAAAFFDNPRDSNQRNTATATSTPSIEVFAQLSLSRPLLRGVAAMGFVQPTPIQASVIPYVLQGRDVCASAVTGSGKTAAFVLPILERLLHRTSSSSSHQQQHRSTRALVLVPTRELAAQCLGMLTSLAQFIRTPPVTAVLIVGGSKNTAAQAAELRTRPDWIVATPGRLLDHVTNTPGVTLQDIEFLVLDEADRLLDLGFQDEIMELVRECPPSRRQTLLFSATLTTKVDDLIQLSLKNPVRVRAATRDSDSRATKDGEFQLAPRLAQEFVRVQSGNEGINRQAMLLALLTRTFTHQVICFFDTKVMAHRLMILCGLCGIRCAELHGNLTQPQRLAALEEFRCGDVDVLLATDLAARGLDLDRVQTVINFEMPSQMETYVHRIGRAARAGRSGQSCTLIGEGRRHFMKDIIKTVDSSNKNNNKRSSNNKVATAKGVIRSRSIPAAVIAHFAAKIQMLEPHVEEVLEAEVVARMDRLAEMEAIKAQNIIEHADEIQARPQREWFATPQQKKQTKEAVAERQKRIAEAAGTGTHRMTRKKRRAREVLQALQSQDDEGGDRDGDDNKNGGQQRKSTQINIKSEARKQKRMQEAEVQEAYGKSVHDYDVQEKKRALKKKKSTASSSGDAAGDDSLFKEEMSSSLQKGRGSKNSDEKISSPATPKSTFHFRGYDPDKKLGKLKSHKSFKSKAKYKRRK